MKAMNALRLWLGLACLAGTLPTATMAQYVRTDLVSNQANVGAAHTDTQHLMNAWGLTQLQLGNRATPFWISDNATGFSTLYTGTGVQARLFVTIPPAPNGATGTLGTPTGTVGNSSPTPTDFTISENGQSGRAIFIFATLDGTISGWTPAVDAIDPSGLSHATIAIDRSGVGAAYTGLAIATNQQGQTFLFAADDGPNRRIDRIDGSFNPNNVKSFSDPEIPRNFTPYGIQEIDGKIWVTFTALNKAQGGFVDVFDTEGNVIQHFAVNGPLHSPWGVAKAPTDFGPMSNAILISNNTSRGRVNAFDANGNFLGPLRDATGQVIEIDQLWGIRFGLDGGPNTAHNQLFFTAGPNTYSNGLFGVITAGN
jgi:uncharacterized protein (TIGR03118 family)